jgi:putative phosphoesterase
MQSGQQMRIGVISDTHGVLRPSALAALAGVDLIIHAGDVGRVEVLEGLRAEAPVVAVRGNVDRDAWADALPLTETVQAGRFYLYVLHDISRLDLDPAAGGFAAVIYGHSHKPVIEQRGDVLYLNPGSAGARRFSLPVSLALLEMNEAGLSARLVKLEAD